MTAGLLAVAVALALVVAALALSRRSTHRLENLGSVSQRWLAVHRTEN